MTRELELKEAFSFFVEDVSGHHKVKAAGVSPDMTVGELVQGLIPRLGLPATADDRPVSYHLRDGAGRNLHASEIVGDVLEPGESVVLQPNIMAG